MARQRRYRNFKTPVAIAATRTVSQSHRWVAAAAALATAIALLFHPIAGLTVAGAGLWQALSAH
jgi:hypothetical protein